MSSSKKSGVLGQIAEKGLAATAASLSSEEAIAISNTYGTLNYKPMPVVAARGEGARVWDPEGNEYIDCIGAYSAVAHGHCSPAITQVIAEQLERIAVTSRAMHSVELPLFLKAICEYSDLDMACPMNSGAEAVETCIKLARKWAYTIKGVPTGEAEIIACNDNFHGRTTTIVGFSTEEGYKEFFGPYTPGFKTVPYGDLEALEAAITPNTAAFLAEPIQAEGGIIMPPEGWLNQVRDLCDRHNILLIWDEVQTGFCRTGDRFAWNHEDAKPDLMSVGKPLGGGVMPVSAALGQRHVMEVLKPGEHGSTFGGSPISCAVGLAAMAEMETQDYAGRSRRLGQRMLDGLSAMNSPLIKEIRGRGLLVGMEVHESVDSAALGKELIGRGVLTKETRHRTFRFTPPIVIEEELIDEVLNRTESALKAVSG